MSVKKKYYPEPKSDISSREIEESVLKFWNENKIFEKSIKNREKESKDNDFVFFDGPPFANGMPHYGHILAGYIKDTVARYKTMKGKRVLRQFGWDCHGLPAEMNAEKTIGISGKKAIEEYGIDKFNEFCKSDALRFTKEWKEYVNRCGRWVDFENGYKTMNLDYMESVIHVFKQLYDKGLIYEDFRVMPYSWKCQTPLSNAETKMDNSYREKADKAVTVKFKLLEPNKLLEVINHSPLEGESNEHNSFGGGINSDNSSPLTPSPLPQGARDFGVNSQGARDNSLIYILAWTTTPWTLPSNLALTINKEIDYVLLEKDNEYYVIGEPLLSKYKKELAIDDKGNFNIITKFKGEKLLGLHYEPLLPYLANLKEVKESKNAFSIIHGDFVTTTDGTGIVHTAPGFGEDDNNVCKAVGIPTVCPVDDGGCFTDVVFDFEGQQVFETNDPIIIKLKQENKWLKTEQYIHNYPHCWRTDTPLIYRAISSWYVKVESIKEKLLKNNELINWMPNHLKHGRFGKWLEGARDWSISRNRYFGCPIPIWKSTDPKYPRIDVYGSISELEKDFGVKVTDLHRPYIDKLTRKNPDDPTGNSMMVRVPEVLDCWFESGSMPYAQLHYPFENKEFFEKNFPADFITEGDQTRGWFYTLTVLSTALFDKPAFKNVISFGNIVGENGKKLSKRLKNYVDPYEAFNTYGSDTVRWLLMRSPVVRCEEFAMSQDGKDMKEILRTCIKPILNSYNFFCLYANSDGIKAEKSFSSKNIMDRYILSKLKETVQNIEKSMDNYEIGNACRESENFFEILNNWYIRRNKNRFWKSEIDQDKQDAYNTLFTVLITMCEAIASLLPFTSEYIWKGLRG